MKSQWQWYGALAAFCLFARPALADEGTLNVIVITASLRPIAAADLPQSVTVLDRDTLEQAGVTTRISPFCNWAIHVRSG